jgi:hypothetical protein
MKKVIIKDKDGIQKAGAEMLDPSQWIAECVVNNSWGKPERWVLHKDEPMAEVYDESDVLEERLIQEESMPPRKEVKLKSEYSIDIIDVSQEHALREVMAKRIAEYPSPAEFLNAYFDGGLDLLREKRLQVKAKYPKP